MLEIGSLIEADTSSIYSDTWPLVLPTPESIQATTGASFIDTFRTEMFFKDGFFYNSDGIRHVRHGEEGNYTYEETTTIGTVEGPVPDDVVGDMVKQAVVHTVGSTSP